MDEISTAEMVGHLRQAGRLFKSFQRATECAELLKDFEDKENALKESIEHLTEERKNLNIACEIVVQEIEAEKTALKVLTNKNTEKVVKSKAETEKIFKAAEIKADKIISTANDKVKSVIEEIGELKKEKEIFIKERDKAQNECEVAKKLVSDFKSTFAKS